MFLKPSAQKLLPFFTVTETEVHRTVFSRTSQRILESSSDAASFICNRIFKHCILGHRFPDGT